MLQNTAEIALFERKKSDFVIFDDLLLVILRGLHTWTRKQEILSSDLPSRDCFKDYIHLTPTVDLVPEREYQQLMNQDCSHIRLPIKRSNVYIQIRPSCISMRAFVVDYNAAIMLFPHYKHVKGKKDMYKQHYCFGIMRTLYVNQV